MYSSVHADLALKGSLTDRFSPISLSALNSKAEMLRRRDNKYVIERRVMENAMQEFALGFDVLEIGGARSFQYDTCYFDSGEHGCYQDHHRGRRRRAKVRIRNYVGADLCFVEVKLKDKRGETIKRRLKYDPAKCHHLDIKAKEFVQECYQELYGTDFPYQLKRVLDMSYERVTLVAKDGGERMTIDNGLSFHSNYGMEIVNKDLFVVETKSANGNGIADKVLRKMHRHPQKHCSKYCVGTAILTPEIKTNNFKMVLRKLLTPAPTLGITAH
jgi:VTC domain